MDNKKIKLKLSKSQVKCLAQIVTMFINKKIAVNNISEDCFNLIISILSEMQSFLIKKLITLQYHSNNTIISFKDIYILSIKILVNNSSSNTFGDYEKVLITDLIRVYDQHNVNNNSDHLINLFKKFI